MTIILIIILILLLTNPNIVSYEVINAAKLWLFILLPTIFPSFVFIDLLSADKFINKLCERIYLILKPIFKINCPKSAYIILISLICGAPASTKLIKKNIDNKEITQNEGFNIICSFSTLSLPYTIFICNKIGINPIFYYVLFLLLATIWMNIFNKKETPIIMESFVNESSFIDCFFESIKKNVEIALNILCIIIIFRVMISLTIKNNSFLYSFIEILGGHTQTNNKFIILSSLGFLSFSLHFQMLSIDKTLNYRKFLLSRLFFCSLGFLCFL